jgi:hypothetical protein
MKVSAKDLHRIIREELQIIEAHDDSFNSDPVRYPASQSTRMRSMSAPPSALLPRVASTSPTSEAATVAYMNRLDDWALGNFKDDIDAARQGDNILLPTSDRGMAIKYMAGLEHENMTELYDAAVDAAKAREEQEMTRRGRREGVDLWNRIVGPRGDANSGTGYTLKEGPGSDDYTDPSDIVSRGWRERADEKLRQDAAALKKHIASPGSDEELPHPFASSGEETEEDKTYGLHRGYGSRRPR